MLREFISKIDLFGKSVLFTYKGNAKSKSKFGAFMTIALLCFVIFLIFYFGRAIVNKNSPTSNTFATYNDNPPPTPLNLYTFPFGFSLEDPYTYNYYINESIYTVRAYTYQTTRVPQENGTVELINVQVPLELEICTSDHFGDLAVNFSYIALNQMYCLKPYQSNLNGSDIILQGTFESPVYQSIIIDIYQCNNATSNNTCGTQEEMNQKLEGGYMGLAYPNLAVDLTDHKTPIKKYRDGYYTTIGNSYSKDVTIDLQQIEISTDSGWLTDDYNSVAYVKLDTIEEYFMPTSKGYIVSFTVRLGNLDEHYKRSYIKVQDITAQVYGMATLAFAILFILLGPYARLTFYQDLINEVFEVRLIKGNPENNRDSDNNNNNNSNSNSPRNDHQGNVVQKANEADRQNDPELTNKEPRNASFHWDTEQLKRSVSSGFGLLERKGEIELQPLKKGLSFGATSSYVRIDTEPVGLNKQVDFAALKLPVLSSKQQPETGPDEVNIDIGNPGSFPVLTRKPESVRLGINNEQIEGNGEKRIEYKQMLTLDKSKISSSREKRIQRLQAGLSLQKCKTSQQNAVSHPGWKKTRNLSEGMSNNEKNGAQSQGKEIELTTDILQLPMVIDNEESGEKRENGEENNIQNGESIVVTGLQTINLSFWEYIRSFFSKSEDLQEKIWILKEGIRRIDEKLDVFVLIKQSEEFDKLKAVLEDNEQHKIFDSLPRPKLALVTSQDIKSGQKLELRSTIKQSQSGENRNSR